MDEPSALDFAAILLHYADLDVMSVVPEGILRDAAEQITRLRAALAAAEKERDEARSALTGMHADDVELLLSLVQRAARYMDDYAVDTERVAVDPAMREYHNGILQWLADYNSEDKT